MGKIEHSPPPRRWRRYLRETAVVLAAFALLHFWQTRHVPAGVAPELGGQLANGQSGSLGAFRAAHPGQATAIHFWAEWCPVCRAEEGNVEALRQQVPVFTVALQSGNAAAVSQILGARRLDWPTLVDDDGRLSARYGVQSVPALVVIDATGRLRFAEVGYVTRAGMYWRLWWATHVP